MIIKTVMNAWRKKPKIDYPKSEQDHGSYKADSGFCFLVAVIIILAYVITKYAVGAISRTTSNSGSLTDQIISYGILAFIVLSIFIFVGDYFKKQIAFSTEREKWAKGCKSAQLRIVRRHKANPKWDDYTNDYVDTRNTITLEMNSDQKASAPNSDNAIVEVRDYVFTRLKEHSQVVIYYEPDSPLTFLLKEEI